MLRLNPDTRLGDIPLFNPAKLSLEELHQISEHIYTILQEELLKPEGRKIAQYMTSLSAEIAKRA